MTPEDMGRLKDMLAELNQILEARAAARSPTSRGSWRATATSSPRTRDPRRAARGPGPAHGRRCRPMMASMTPERRGRSPSWPSSSSRTWTCAGRSTSSARSCAACSPTWGGTGATTSRARTRSAWPGRRSTLEDLGDLDRLEQLLRGASQPCALPRSTSTGPVACSATAPPAASTSWPTLTQLLQKDGLIDQREGRLELTPKGLRRIGRNALHDLFQRLARDRLGRTTSSRPGSTTSAPTRPSPTSSATRSTSTSSGPSATPSPAWAAAPRWGSPRRLRGRAHRAGGQLVHRADVPTCRCRCRCAATPAAKKVAMALHSLISTQFPPATSWGCGLQRGGPPDRPQGPARGLVGLRLRHQHAARLPDQPAPAGRESGTKLIIMITDGEPTAHFEPNMGRPFFSYPPVPTVGATFREVVRCTTRASVSTVRARPDRPPALVRRAADQPQQGAGVLHYPRDPGRLRAGRLHRAEA